jgi:hypothetical protein
MIWKERGDNSPSCPSLRRREVDMLKREYASERGEAPLFLFSLPLIRREGRQRGIGYTKIGGDCFASRVRSGWSRNDRKRGKKEDEAYLALRGLCAKLLLTREMR